MGNIFTLPICTDSNKTYIQLDGQYRYYFCSSTLSCDKARKCMTDIGVLKNSKNEYNYAKKITTSQLVSIVHDKCGLQGLRSSGDVACRPDPNNLRLQFMIDSLQSQIKKLEEQAHKDKTEISNINNLIVQAKQRAEDAEWERKNADNKLRAANEERDRANEDKDRALRAKEETDDLYQQAQQELEDAQKNTTSLTNSLDQATRAKSIAETAKQAANDRVSSAENRANVVERAAQTAMDAAEAAKKEANTAIEAANARAISAENRALAAKTEAQEAVENLNQALNTLKEEAVNSQSLQRQLGTVTKALEVSKKQKEAADMLSTSNNAKKDRLLELSKAAQKAAESNYTRIEEELQQSKQKNKNAESQINELLTKTNELTEQLINNVSDNKAELHDFKSTLLRKTQELEQSRQNMAILISDYKIKEQHLQQLTSQLEALGKDKGGLPAQKDALQENFTSQREALQAELDAQSSQFESVKAKLAAQTSTLQTKEIEWEATKSDYNATKDRLQTTEVTLLEVQERLKKTQTLLTSSQTKTVDKQKLYDLATSDFIKKKDENNNLKEELTKVNSALARSQQMLSDIENQSKGDEDFVNIKQNINDRLTLLLEKNTLLTQQLNASGEEKAELQQKIDRLNEQIDLNTEELDTVTKQMTDEKEGFASEKLQLTEQITKLSSDLSKLEMEKSGSALVQEELRQGVEDTRKQVAAMQGSESLRGVLEKQIQSQQIQSQQTILEVAMQMPYIPILVFGCIALFLALVFWFFGKSKSTRPIPTRPLPTPPLPTPPLPTPIP